MLVELISSLSGFTIMQAIIEYFYLRNFKERFTAFIATIKRNAVISKDRME